MSDRPRRGARLAPLIALARQQGGVVSRAQVYATGVSRGELRAQVRAARWQPIGHHCVALQTGPLTERARYFAAVLEAGPRAFLDGATALVDAGLQRFDTDHIRVSVPRGARIRHRGTAVDIRQTRRWDPTDLDDTPLPRARPAVAAIRAALWARTDRQAALVLTMTVQQGVACIEDLSAEMLRIRRHRRRSYLHTVLIDLAGGVGSLGELDVLHGCRDRGLPVPDRQVLRRTPEGCYYLDFRWRGWGLVVEVDGIQHAWAENLVADALRHNRIAMDGDTVLRLPVLGLRTCPDAFFAQIREALSGLGWRG